MHLASELRDGLARVVFLLGVIGVEKAANARMARAIDVKQLWMSLGYGRTLD